MASGGVTAGWRARLEMSLYEELADGAVCVYDLLSTAWQSPRQNCHRYSVVCKLLSVLCFLRTYSIYSFCPG